MRIWQHKRSFSFRTSCSSWCSQLIQEVWPGFRRKNEQENNPPKLTSVNIKLQKRSDVLYIRFKCPGFSKSARCFPHQRRARGCFCCCSSWSETEEPIFTRQILLCREKCHVPETREAIGWNAPERQRLSAWWLAISSCQSSRPLTTQPCISNILAHHFVEMFTEFMLIFIFHRKH